MNRKIEKLQSDLLAATSKRDYAKVTKIQKKLKPLLAAMNEPVEERVTLATVLESATPKQKDEALGKMHRVFILSDLLYGAVVDFEDYLSYMDSTIVIEVTQEAKEAIKLLHGITKNVDAFNNKEMSENFGDACDEALMILDNVISKRFQKTINKNNNGRG